VSVTVNDLNAMRSAGDWLGLMRATSMLGSALGMDTVIHVSGSATAAAVHMRRITITPSPPHPPDTRTQHIT
jgi:hypothetical protein